MELDAMRRTPAPSEAGSLGSVAALECGACSDDEDDGGGGGGGVGPLPFDDGMWPGGPCAYDASPFALGELEAAAVAAAAADADLDDADDDASGGDDDAAVGSTSAPAAPALAPWRRRDTIGLAGDGRRMFCDYHDLDCGCPGACMAADMRQQPQMEKLIGKHLRRRARRPRDNPDGRDARHACYKAVVAWQWASPLGAENRVRLPRCLTISIRQLFPNVCCGAAAGCDYAEGCESRGHYTGFRTAEESRAIREGQYLDADVL